MHIAIYHNLPSGGAKRALQQLVKRLGAVHSLDVYTLKSANHSFADIRPFVKKHEVYDFEPSPLLSSPWGRLNQALRLHDLLRLRQVTKRIASDIEKQGYDVVFVHGCQYEKAPSLLEHIQALPKVYYCQESLRRLYEAMPARPYAKRTSLRAMLDRADLLPALYDATLRQLDRRYIHRADCVLVNSEFSRSAIQRIYQIDAKVSYLGVDLTQFCPDQRGRDSFVLSVGSLTPLKGFDFLITALGTVTSSQRPKLVIASNFQDANERDYLTTLATASMVDLHLVGSVSDEQLVDLYNRAKVTLYAPIREPFGLVALESMACGTPVVAVNEGGIRETVVHGCSGLLTERDANEFGSAVQTLLSDRDLAKSFAETGRKEILEKWSWEHAAIRIENHLTTASLRPKAH